MKIEVLIMDYISSKTDIQKCNIKEISSGIRMFVRDKGLDVFAEKTDDPEKLRMLVHAYMSPFSDMPEEELRNYFRYYGVIKDLESFSHQALSYAIARQEGKPADKSEIENLRSKIEAFFEENYRNTDMGLALDNAYSEIVLDLDFAAGKSDLRSIRLNNYFRK